jgi:hypothetical protein
MNIEKGIFEAQPGVYINLKKITTVTVDNESGSYIIRTIGFEEIYLYEEVLSHKDFIELWKKWKD